MKELQQILTEEDIKKLEQKKEIIYFNYFGKNIDFSKIPKEYIEKLSKGDSHAIVGDDLYVKLLNSFNQYGLVEKGFLKGKKNTP